MGVQMTSQGREALAYALRLAHAELERKRHEQQSLEAGLEQLERLLESDEMPGSRTLAPSPTGVSHSRGK